MLGRMKAEGFLDARSFARACARPIQLTREAFPLLSPHVVARMGEGTSSIDPELQAAVEAVAARVPAPDGVAIVVVDVETGRVRALAGATAADARVLDATRRPRSAGSTWKPFLYALAFDQGLAVPTTTLWDLPFATADWDPSNFDRSFQGPVSASAALSSSLNLPAIRLAASLPIGLFADRLSALGFHHVRRGATDLALDLAIGTDDATAMELVSAYAALARGGYVIEPTLAYAGAAAPRRPVLSRGACQLVTRILADRSRPRPMGAPLEGIAWKTGTSSRRRDAWAAGYTSRVAAVVWRGRLDGGPDASLVGAEAAAPSLFEVLNLADPTPSAFEAPRSSEITTDVVDMDVCAETGLAAGSACFHRRRDQRPCRALKLAPCPVHRSIEVDQDSCPLLCSRCRSRHVAVERRVALWSPVCAQWRQRAGLASLELPSHAESCETPLEPESAMPVVTSPRSGRAVECDASGRASFPIRVLAPDPSSAIEILMDGESVGSVPSGVAVVRSVRAGRHTLTAISASGRRATLRFEAISVP